MNYYIISVLVCYLVAKPLGIDPNRGIGTAYEGILKIPKPGGVRKGWMRQFAVVCDFKLFLFDMMEGKSNQSNLEPSHIIDMRWECFNDWLVGLG